ncbi:2-phospho-L-lactate transferase [Jatrophihabitans telluris]|uniref:2-phospho-L-lactate transferase n=1 Tax=Jatrophihabitans telluris TaxID=2038343 RepID=A0ABY4QV79_9ACTN|nr:2-phospho-L-lactate transferase [Jatrophihabitans telluris]UQX87544.1 2-phospho-L-lactate transferase [Jatrophihabitans telluris]
MRITVLAGGIGGAKFLTGVRAFAEQRGQDGDPSEVTAIVNTGDDVTMHGLRITPDLDSVLYTLAGVIDTERGWGRAGESWRIKQALAEYGAEPSWFGLGDLDIATHLVRTQMLDAGYRLSDVTAALSQRWQPGVRLLPMTDERCETHVVVSGPGPEDPRRAIHFQEWWVRYRAGLAAEAFVQVGLDQAKPAPGVIEAIAGADLVLVAPSNPVVSIGTILAVDGIGEAVRTTSAPVVGLSPIVGGAPVRGMADRCLAVIGVPTTAEGVGLHYGSRRDGGLLDGWLVHSGDSAVVPGVSVRQRPLLMTSAEVTAEMVADAAGLVGIST